MMFDTSEDHPQPDQEVTTPSTNGVGEPDQYAPQNNTAVLASPSLIPAFEPPGSLTKLDLRARFADACTAWLTKSPSPETRDAYMRELRQFLAFAGIDPRDLSQLALIRPHNVSAWRDDLRSRGLSNAAIMRKITVLRSLFTYLQTYGYTGANPAHSHFVALPPLPRDGKTVGLSPEDCRRVLDAPALTTPEGFRDRALFAVLAYTGCRVGELCRLRVGDYKSSGGHHLLEIRGKGGRERRVAVHPEAIERLESWLDIAHIRDDSNGALFLATRSARGRGNDGFHHRGLSRRAVQLLVARYVERLRLDPAVTVHSFRVTALTTARERGSEIIDLKEFAGHADPRTTLTYIRSRDRLSKSPAYVLAY